MHAAPALAGVSPIGVRVTPRLVGVGRRGHVALTFDDGPDPHVDARVPRVLDELGWRATFFMLGDMVRRAPGVAARGRRAGHEVAVHGDVHGNMLRRTPRATERRHRRAYDTIAAATGRRAALVPAAVRHPVVVRVCAPRGATGMSTVLWTTWGRDWRREATPETVVADVTRRYVDGGTVLLHDSDCESYPGSWKSTLGALPRLAEEFAARGLTVGTVGDHGIESARTTTYPR